MKRRQVLLASSSWFAALVSGCLGGGLGPGNEPRSVTAGGTENETTARTVWEAPVDDCENASRPSSAAEETDPPGADERYSYPQRPASLSPESALRPYVKAYERAYRLNELYSQHGTALEHARVSVDETTTYEAPENAVIGRLTYTYGYEVNQGEDTVIADSPTTYASYYVDETVVLWAVERGHQEDESKLVPDPMEHGLAVECF